MLDVASLAALQLYEKTVERLVMQWPRCWHLIVMADDKGRAEWLEKICRKFVVEEDCKRMVPVDWNREKPWTACFQAPAPDNEYWDEQVRHPAAAWLASGGRGAASAPAEQVAMTHLPGGLDSIEVDKEEDVEPRRKQANRDRRQARATRIRSEREELEKLRKVNHPGQAAGSGKAKGKGKSKEGWDADLLLLRQWDGSLRWFGTSSRFRRGHTNVSIAFPPDTETATVLRRLEGYGGGQRAFTHSLPQGRAWTLEGKRG